MFDAYVKGPLVGAVAALAFFGCGDPEVVEVTDHVEVSNQCCGVVFSRDGSRAYASSGAAVHEVNLQEGKLSSSYPISTPDNRLTDIDADGTLLLVSFQGASLATIKGGSITGTRVIKGNAINDAVLAAGRVYATSFNDRGVWYAPAQGQPSQTLIKPYGQSKTAGPGYMARSLDGRHVYFTDGLNSAIHKLDTALNKVTGTFLAGREGGTTIPMALSAMATHVVTLGSSLYVLDLGAPGQIPTIINLPAGWRPRSVAFSPWDNRLIYTLATYHQTSFDPETTPPQGNRIFAIDASTAEVVGRSSVPVEMLSMAVSPDGTRALGAGSGNLYFMDIMMPQREQ